jgi:uncharacterized membrane protein YhaH (DUF805 family)
MTFAQAVQSCIKKYGYFNGRATRSEFWWWALFFTIVHFAADRVSKNVGTLVVLLMLFPTLAVTSRRLHDIGKSGWWQIVGCVPLIGWAVMVYWWVQKSTGDNQYGDADANSRA